MKPNTVRRRDNTIRVLPGVLGSFGRLVTIGILVALLAWLAIAPLGITTISPVSGVTPARKIKAANITTAAFRARSAHSSLETAAIRALELLRNFFRH